MINAVCPNCGKKFQAPEKLGGKKVRCRGCTEMFALPMAGASAPGVPTSQGGGGLLDGGDFEVGFKDDDQFGGPGATGLSQSPKTDDALDDTGLGVFGLVESADVVTDGGGGSGMGGTGMGGMEAGAPRQTPLSGIAGFPGGGSQSARPAGNLGRGVGSGGGAGGNANWQTETAVGQVAMPGALAGGDAIGGGHGVEVAVAGDNLPTKPRSTWFWHPQVILLDRWLPRVAVVVGLLWLGLSMSGATVSTQPAWVWITRSAIGMALYTLLIVPLTHVAIRMAAGSLKRSMPKAATWRTFASYFPAFLITVVIYNAGAGWSGMVIFGVVLGLAIGGAMVLLLFRLEPSETGVYAGYASGGFVTGALVAGAMLYVGNMVLVKSLTGQKTAGLPTESFIWPYLAWVEPVKEEPVVVKPRPRPAATAPVTGTVADGAGAQGATAGGASRPVAGSSGASNAVPAGATQRPTGQTLAGQTPAGQPPSGEATPAKPSPGPSAGSGQPSNIFTPEGSKDDAKGTPAPTPPTPTVQPVVGAALPTSTSALKVNEIWPASIGEFETLIRPPGGGSVALVVRKRDGENTPVEVFDSVTWSTLGTVTLTEPAGPFTGSAETSYAVSPDGTRIARLSRVPKPLVQVLSVATGMVEQRLPIPEGVTNLQLVGFFRPTRLMYRATGPNGQAIVEWFDVANTSYKRKFENPDAGGFGSLIGLSGRSTSATLSRRVAGKHVLSVVNLESARVESAGKAGGIAVDIDVTLNPTPSGLAYSPDGKVLVAFYPLGGGLLYYYSLAPIKDVAVAPVEFSGNPVGRFPEQFVGSALSFSPDGRMLLLYGDALLDAATGVRLDRLGVPGVVSAQFASDDTIDLLIRLPSGEKKVMRVKLDQEKLAAKISPKPAPR